MEILFCGQGERDTSAHTSAWAQYVPYVADRGVEDWSKVGEAVFDCAGKHGKEALAVNAVSIRSEHQVRIRIEACMAFTPAAHVCATFVPNCDVYLSSPSKIFMILG